MKESIYAISLLSEFLAKHDVKARFILVGVWNTVFGYLVFFVIDTLFEGICRERYHAYMLAMVSSQVIATVNAFAFHKYVTFKSKVKGKGVIFEFYRFCLTYVFTFSLSLILLPFFVEVFSIQPKLSAALVIPISVVISYYGHSRFSFGDAKCQKFNFKSITVPIIYVIGLLHWYLFLNYNSPTFTSGDWHFGHQLFDVFKQALITGRIPFHATLYASDSLESTMYGTSHFLSMPWIVMPPLLFLLKFFSIPVFITCQFWLYYTISFIVVLKWTKKLNLSISASVFLLILFNFHGALVSKASAGQTVWGYMLIPWFLWIIYKFIENDKPSRSKSLMIMLEFSFLLFFLLLSGDMHNFYQFVLVGFCVLMFYPGRILRFVSGTLIGVVLSAWYFIPNLLFSAYASSGLPPEGHWRRSGIFGYGFQNADSGVPLLKYSADMPVVKNILILPINILNHIWEGLTYSFNASHDGVWEYNLYISYLGVILIIGSLIAIFIKYKPLKIGSLKQYRYFLGAIIVFLLSIGPFNYMLIKFLQYFHPFNPIDAIPSRLMLYPFSMVLLVSSLGFDSMFKIFPEKIRLWLKWAVLFVLLALLMGHSYKWWLIQANAIVGFQFQGEFKTTIYDNIDDGFYKVIVIISYLSSIMTVSCGGFFYLWLKRHENNKLIPKLNGS